MTDLTCKRCNGTGQTTRDAFTYTDSRTGQQTHYPAKTENCIYCDGKGAYPPLDVSMILAAIKGRKGLRTAAPKPRDGSRGCAVGSP